MAAEALRVALLARPGDACDRLRGVLEQAGTRQVLEADPTTLELSTLVQAAPQAVLVALDPGVENVLERFDDVLFDPSVDVIYEEAELIVAREGWDVARWQRHLVAKLHRHGDVLPPGREPDDIDEDGGQPAPQERAGPSEVAAGIDTWEPVIVGHSPFDPVAAEAADAGDEANEAFETLEMATTTTEADDPGMVAADTQRASRFGELSLDDDSATDVAVSTESRQQFSQDLNELQDRISGLELVDDTPVSGPEQARGAVLVLAGIGGPDAVRQLLGALPPEFARPVLVQQHLDGARYDKLVAQMQRATSAPVQLAESGQVAHAGFIYILPAAVGIDVSDVGLRFNDGGELLEALPSADSAVLLLSGSDPNQVDAVMKHSWAGALVAGQSAEGCYDAAASNALAARGGDTDTAVKLAKRLVERWS